MVDAQAIARKAAAASADARAVNPKVVVNANFGGKPESATAGAAPQARRLEPAQPSAAERLLQFESDVRDLRHTRELSFHIVNELRRFIKYQQAFFVYEPRRPRVKAVSSLADVDRNAPLVRWIESIVAALRKDKKVAEVCDFALPAYGGADEAMTRSYPFHELLWLPLTDRNGNTFAGVLLARTQPWMSAETALAARISGTYSHAWLALLGSTSPPKAPLLRRAWPWVAAAALLSAVVPVPMTTLAPAEVVARDPNIITAPITGVIDRILVPANSTVTKGDSLVRLVDTELRNQFEVAQKAVLVAQAGLQKTTGGAFDDPGTKRELAIARTELELKRAERDYYQALLAQTVITAPKAGLVVFENPEEWAGKPVTVGERIMALADPQRVELRVDLAVEDAITLDENAAVRLFLHADPLNAVDAKVHHAAYRAQPAGDGQLTYKLQARFDAPSELPRIGLRGTAKVYGPNTLLGFYLLRRPIAALRQLIGW